MNVYTLEQCREVGLRLTYRRSRFWQKKKSSSLFEMKLILILSGVCKEGKLSHLGHRKPFTHTLKSLRIQNESLFGVDFGPEASFWNFPSKIGKKRQLQSMAISLSGHVEQIFLFTKIEEENTLATFGFNRTALPLPFKNK